MIKVLLLYIVYPFALASYFRKALEHREDIDLKVVGPFTGSWIPWLGGVNLPEKYVKPPDIPLPFPPNVGQVSYALVKAQLGDWVPDLVLSIDAGITWVTKPSDGVSATIATDPHVLSYGHQRQISDKFFNMQRFYSEPKDIYLPYAYSQYDHFPTDTEKDTDAVLIGMPYQNRFNWVNQLRNTGVSVIFENGPVFDEARALYNRGRIGLNWSSLNDLNARAFEIPAMKLCPVMNVVPDLYNFPFCKDNLGFSGLSEAVEQVRWAVSHPEEAKELAESAYTHVQGHTYDARIEQVLKECGLV